MYFHYGASRQNEMASNHSIHSYSDAQAPSIAVSNNVMSFPSQRAILSVSLACSEKDHGQEQLRGLLYSALGVYVVDTRIEKGEITVRFDIAMDDVDFTLHTLIKDLPEAMIGRLERKTYPQRYEAPARSASLQLI
jgi:hypothetical protein